MKTPTVGKTVQYTAHDGTQHVAIVKHLSPNPPEEGEALHAHLHVLDTHSSETAHVEHVPHDPSGAAHSWKRRGK